MGVADNLCEELFHWIQKLEKCAKNLENLAKELEHTRGAVTASQLVGNTATVLGSAVLLGTGIATLMTGGLAAPLLVTAASATAGAGALANIGWKLFENWKSSKTMKNAEETIGEIDNIWNKIERLQQKLEEECSSQNPEERQCEITARILRAMAKRSGKNLSLTRLVRILRNDGLTRNILPVFIDKVEFFKTVSALLTAFGYTLIVANTAAKEGAKFVPLAVTEGMAGLSLKAVLKGTGQLAGGAIGLAISFPDLIDNCENLIKNKHETEASTQLRTKAKEIHDMVNSFKSQLNRLQEMLSLIPETECHVDLGIEKFGFQEYTRGTICMEYKPTIMQDRKIQKFIFLSTKDMRETDIEVTRKSKSDGKTDKNKRRKPAQTSDIRFNKIEKTSQREKPPKFETISEISPIQLPTITMSNLRSLPNKIEEIEDMMENAEYFPSDLMFFTETWLTSNSNDINLDGYTPFRVDRDARLTQKHRGGGLIMLVNDNWASDVEVENIMITPDYELMVVSIIPHDHPENAPPLTFIHVYVPGPNFKQAAIDIAGFYYDALENSNGGPVFLLGDFNRCDILPYSNNLEQYVTCPTRRNNILDLCYGNMREAYRCVCRPPLGRSDHNVIHLIPKKKRGTNDPLDEWKCTHDHHKPKEE